MPSSVALVIFFNKSYKAAFLYLKYEEEHGCLWLEGFIQKKQAIGKYSNKLWLKLRPYNRYLHSGMVISKELLANI